MERYKQSVCCCFHSKRSGWNIVCHLNKGLLLNFNQPRCDYFLSRNAIKLSFYFPSLIFYSWKMSKVVVELREGSKLDQKDEWDEERERERERLAKEFILMNIEVDNDCHSLTLSARADSFSPKHRKRRKSLLPFLHTAPCELELKLRIFFTRWLVSRSGFLLSFFHCLF